MYDFTVPELNYFRTYCNFTEDERTLFEYRSKNIPLEQCAELMNVSAVSYTHLDVYKRQTRDDAGQERKRSGIPQIQRYA